MPVLMLVDDDPSVALLVRRLSQQCGFATLECPDAETAWETLGRTLPDLALLDINLPGENGLMLCRRIRAEQCLADLPLVHFGQMEHTEQIIAAFEAGMDFFLSKDLLCQPERWARRLHEIYVNRAGRGRSLSLIWQGRIENLVLSSEVFAPFQLALRHPPVRALGGDLLEAFVRMAHRPASGTEMSSWLSPSPGSTDRAVPLAAVLAFTDALTRLLGHEAVTPLQDVVNSVLTRLEQEHQI